MALPLRYSIALVIVAVSFLYQYAVKDLLFITAGIARDIRPISEFPYKCRRIQEPKLQACEDMWLSEQTRELFLACSDPLSRKTWTPNIHRLNESARSPKDVIIAMDIDRPSGDSFKHRILRTLNMPPGDERLHLLGFTGVSNPANTLLYLINNRPSIDPQTGALLDNSETGANSTIEIFETAPRSSSIVHLKTLVHPLISTPNRLALIGSENYLYMTNDHGPHKSGLLHTLSPFLSTGTITLCNPSLSSSSPSTCTLVSPSSSSSSSSSSSLTHSFPNGLVFSPYDSLLYVPSTWKGGIQVFSPQPDGSLVFVDKIPLPYPIDNLSVDGKGDVFAAVIPKATEFPGAVEDPEGRSFRSGVFRVRNLGEGKEEGMGKRKWEVKKILEDRDMEVVSGVTTVVHDVRTRRLFLSGIVAGWVTVCEAV